MSEWKECKLEDVAVFQRGHDLPKAQMNYGNIPVAGSNGIIGYHDSATTKGPGLTIGRSGNIGTPRFYISDFWAHNTVLYVKDFKGNDEKFVFYFMHTFDFAGFNAGSAVPTLNRNHIHEIRVMIPPLPEQRSIASVLSCLDDKIDLLHRQNKTLEAMAETLFRQWFVEEADEDWEEVELEYVAERITDGAHHSPPTVDTGMPMASVKDMHDWGIDYTTCRRISDNYYEKLVKDDCRPLKNDILIAKDGSYLKHIFVVPENMDVVILSSIAIIRPNGKYHPLLLSILLKMDSTKELLKNIVTGAVIPRIVLKDFRKFKILLPPVTIQNKALTVIEPIIKKCWKNMSNILTLEKLRDTLLPKLMNGEVRVEI